MFLTIFGGRVMTILLPLLNKYIVDSMSIGEFNWQIVVCVAVLKAINKILINLRWNAWNRLVHLLQKNVEIRLFIHAHALSWNVKLKKKSGEFSQFIRKSIGATTGTIYSVLFTILPLFLDLGIAVFYLFSGVVPMWWVVLLAMMGYLVATIVLSNKNTKIYEDCNEKWRASNSIYTDSMNNHETVKFFATENYETGRYETSLIENQKASEKSFLNWSILNLTQDFFVDGSTFVVTLAMAYDVSLGNKQTAGDYVLFSTYIWNLYGPLSTFGVLYKNLQKNLMGVKKMFEFLEDETETELEDCIECPEVPGAIEFCDVKFGYDPEKPILKGISFKINPGETVALVGSSGCGKTTIYRLLLRFFDPQEGFITISGIDLRQISRSSLRKHFGIVSQDVELFNDTIGQSFYATQEELEEAAKAAAIHDFITGQEEKYETKVGQKGVKLSGGEKQRVSIARTILKKPRYILLDEATSTLDTHTERSIQENLDELCRSRTSLIIAHRLATIVNADRIMVLKEGLIVESGRHEELLSMKSMYANVWEMQHKPRFSNTNVEKDA